MDHANRLRDRLMETAKIDPSAYAFRTSRSRAGSLEHALAGLLFMLRRQKNTWIMSAITPAVLLVAFWLRISVTGWALLILCITIVWLLEFANAALEASIDLTTSEYHPMAKIGKDVAAAAVLLGVLNAVVVGGLLLGPPMWTRIFGA